MPDKKAAVNIEKRANNAKEKQRESKGEKRFLFKNRKRAAQEKTRDQKKIISRQANFPVIAISLLTSG